MRVPWTERITVHDGRRACAGRIWHATAVILSSARSDGVYAYQLAVVTDDADGGVTEIVRGRDLLSSTPRQLWLQETLGFAHPAYYHVPLLTAPDGRRLSKREKDLDLGALRQRLSPQELLGQLRIWQVCSRSRRPLPLRSWQAAFPGIWSCPTIS